MKQGKGILQCETFINKKRSYISNRERKCEVIEILQPEFRAPDACSKEIGRSAFTI